MRILIADRVYHKHDEKSRRQGPDHVQISRDEEPTKHIRQVKQGGDYALLKVLTGIIAEV